MSSVSAEITRSSTNAVARFLQKRGTNIVREVTSEQRSIGVDLQTYIKTRKLSGRPGLRNITGTLRRSINWRTFNDATSVTSVTTVVGSNLHEKSYAAIHEFGGTIKIPAVTNRLMVFPAAGQLPTRFTKGGKPRRGLRAFSGEQLVFVRSRRAYTVTIPERSYLRSSLRENKADIVRRLDSAVKRGTGASS